MIIRKYLVEDINEALFRIKYELGDDAYIISQKQVRQPGVKGFFRNKKLEVTVGLLNNKAQQVQDNKLLVGDEIKENNASNVNTSPQTHSYADINNLTINNNTQAAKSYLQQDMYRPTDKSKSISYYNKLFEEKQNILNNNFSEDIFQENNNRMQSRASENFTADSNKRFNSYNTKPTPSTIMDLNIEPNYDVMGVNNQISSLNNKQYDKNNLGNNLSDIAFSSVTKETGLDIVRDNVIGDLKKELLEIKSMVSNMSGTVVNTDNSYGYLDEFLYKQDICKELCDEIKANCTLTKEELMNKSIIKNYLRNIFSNIIQIQEQSVSGKIVVLGPTGSGKTTTIAKLAGLLSLNLNKKVGLVTIDTFRVGAIEQLKMYAEIMNIPYKYVTTLNDIKSVFDDMKACDVILVDTIGRSNKNIIHLNELNMFVQSIQSDEVTFVVSAGMKQQDLDNFINSFKGIKFKNVIVTKLDETNSFGIFVNVCYKTSLPISFVTMGQDVPLDIKRADKEEILDMILGE